MADSSFDIVSKVDRQEADNALQQTSKELATRFDFKGTKARVEQDEYEITAFGDADFQVKQVVDILRESPEVRYTLATINTGNASKACELKALSDRKCRPANAARSTPIAASMGSVVGAAAPPSTRSVASRPSSGSRRMMAGARWANCRPSRLRSLSSAPARCHRYPPA